MMPHERAVRAWLARSRVSPEDCDELVQDCYCRFAMLDAFDHIEQPRGYFFAVARHLLGRRLKRARIVPIEAIAEIDALPDDMFPSPEQATAGRLDYARMQAFLAALPERCREIVELRKFEGYSQREIAARLEVSESVVENQIYKGVRALQRAWREADEQVTDRLRKFEDGERRA